MNTEITENLLTAWLRLSTSINNPRIVSDLTYNESLICNLLYNNLQANPDKRITATDLCNQTKMLKSQMNRTLNSLEEKKLITKERSELDKRLIYISMNLKQAIAYKKQHDKILELINIIIDNLGKDNTNKAIEIFNAISDIANKLNLG